MKRWDCQTNKEVEDKKIDAFTKAVDVLCKLHGYTISHEDGHGAFEIEEYAYSPDPLSHAHIGATASTAGADEK